MSFLFEELTREECEAIREEDGYMRGLEEGVAKGNKEGQIKKQHDIAVKMLEMGMEVAVIAEATGMTVNEIYNLQKK